MFSKLLALALAAPLALAAAEAPDSAPEEESTLDKVKDSIGEAEDALLTVQCQALVAGAATFSLLGL